LDPSVHRWLVDNQPKIVHDPLAGSDCIGILPEPYFSRRSWSHKDMEKDPKRASCPSHIFSRLSWSHKDMEKERSKTVMCIDPTDCGFNFLSA
jgi:hypothetical protein